VLMSVVIKGLVFLLVLLCSAFFSSAETALTSLNPVKLRSLVAKKVVGAKRLERILENPRRLLTAILIGNNIANVAASAMATVVILDVLTLFNVTNFALGMAIVTVIMTVIILIFGEITPKTIAIRNPESLALWMARPVRSIMWLFSPFVWLFMAVSGFISNLFGVSVSDVPLVLTEDEMRAMITMGEEEGVLEKEETQMIHGIFDFSEKIVREIMTPRTDAACIEVSLTIQEAIQLFAEKGHSRVPVYETKIDNIIGIVYAKDLLNIDPSVHLDSVRKFMRKAQYIPETKNIEALLQQMKRSKFHMAIVVDEYGGMAGLVTFEDIIEEIIGEVQDEYDQEEMLYQKEGKDQYLIDCKMSMDDLSELLGVTFPEEDDYDTLGGFVLSQLGKFPEKGEVFSFDCLELMVKEISNRRILKIQVTVLDRPEPSQGVD